MLSLTDPKEIVLRDYQGNAIDALRDHIRDGRKRLILCAGTGAGKTLTSAHLLKEAHRKGAYALFIVDRVALVDQTSAVFDEYGIPHGIIQGINPRWSPREHVQVCSAQTLARRSLPRDPDLIVVDEAHCFPAGTAIDTPDGKRNIETLAPGDAVFSAAGVGYVRHVFRNRARQLVRVKFDDGGEVVCTPDHRFFTGNAWMPARLLDGQSAVCLEGMPLLWLHLSAQNLSDQDRKLACRAQGILDQAPMLLSELCKELEESYVIAGRGRKDEGEPSRDWTQAAHSGRERAWPDGAAARAISETWAGLAAGVCGSNRVEGGGWPSVALQDRHSERGVEDRGGDRRPKSPMLARQGKRRPQDGLPVVKRVVSVENVEFRNDVDVFNIEVSGHPSYFAGGALVHNCQYRATLAYMDSYPDAVKIGLTATPFTPGMGKHWDGMVNVIPTRALIDAGHLVEPKIYVAKSPDESEFSKNSFGEYSDESAASAGIRIVGDVVSEWVGKTFEHFGGPAKTIVFSPTVEHGRELCAAFGAAGYNFQQISYLDKNDDERAAKIAEFRRPDSLIHGLVSCGVLTKGFDVPDVRIGVSCKPYRKSLSSHMQEIGRVMRPIQGEEKTALWLDHSGNVERFALDMFDVWENGAGELSKAEKRDSTPRERNEQTREKVVCPECSGALRGSTCMACGWERPARSHIHAIEGELREFDFRALGLEARPGLRAECLRDPRRVWEAALNHCFALTRKGEDHARRWAYGVWRGIYPDAKLPFGWYEASIPAFADQNALALIEREIKRFRKTAKTRMAA